MLLHALNLKQVSFWESHSSSISLEFSAVKWAQWFFIINFETFLQFILLHFLLHYHHHHHHHHHRHHHHQQQQQQLANMQLSHLLTRSGLTHPEVSLMVSPRFFCLSFCSFLVLSVIYYETFCLYVVTNFFCIPVFCPKLPLHSSLMFNTVGFIT